MEPKKKFFIAAVCWTVSITILSLVSLNSVVGLKSFENKDKYVHFVFYLLFTFFWGVALSCSTLKKSILIFFSAVLYGIVMEIAQGIFTTARHPDIYDVFANSMGAFIGWLGLICSFRYFK